MKMCKDLCARHKNHTCCWECAEISTCENACFQDYAKCGMCEIVTETNPAVIFEKTALMIMQKIRDINVQIKSLQEIDDQIRKDLHRYMAEFGILNFENDILKITTVAPSTRTTVDSKRLKAELPEIFEKYSKVSNVSGSVRIEVK